MVRKVRDESLLPSVSPGGLFPKTVPAGAARRWPKMKIVSRKNRLLVQIVLQF
jgi:hypothetical protein